MVLAGHRLNARKRIRHLSWPRPLFAGGLARFRRLGDSHGIALGLYGLAYTRPADALVDAQPHVQENLDILRSVGDRRTLGQALWRLAGINAELGDIDMAAAQFEESLTLFIEFGNADTTPGHDR